MYLWYIDWLWGRDTLTWWLRCSLCQALGLCFQQEGRATLPLPILLFFAMQPQPHPHWHASSSCVPSRTSSLVDHIRFCYFLPCNPSRTCTGTSNCASSSCFPARHLWRTIFAIHRSRPTPAPRKSQSSPTALSLPSTDLPCCQALAAKSSPIAHVHADKLLSHFLSRFHHHF